MKAAALVLSVMLNVVLVYHALAVSASLAEPSLPEHCRATTDSQWKFVTEEWLRLNPSFSHWMRCGGFEVVTMVVRSPRP